MSAEAAEDDGVGAGVGLDAGYAAGWAEARGRGEDALAGPLLPYAMHFGLVQRGDLPLVRFARDWVRALSVLPGWHPEVPKAPDPLSEPVPVDNSAARTTTIHSDSSSVGSA